MEKGGTLKKIFCYLTDNVSRIQPFTALDDPRNRWLAWKRNFNLFVEDCNVEEPKQKLVKLLRAGGIEIQDAYELNKASVQAIDDDGKPKVDDQGQPVLLDDYEAALCVLDLHYAPRTNALYEHHKFRAIRQSIDESFEEFVKRIKQRQRTCSFCTGCAEREAVVQLLEGCRSEQLRTRLLEKEMRWTEAVALGKSLEIVQSQKRDFKPPNFESSVAVVNYKKSRERDHRPYNAVPRHRSSTSFKNKQPVVCHRCGREGHYASDKGCPAWGETCDNCGGKNHFAMKCHHPSSNKRKNDKDEYGSTKRFKVSTVVSQDTPNDFYGVFHVQGSGNPVYISTLLAERPMEFLIDSGAGANLITTKSFELLKSTAAQYVLLQDAQPKLVGYGQKGEGGIGITCSMEALIQAGVEKISATFHVATHGSLNILGRETASRLRLLKTGLEVQKLTACVESEEFPKIPDYQVSTPFVQLCSETVANDLFTGADPHRSEYPTRKATVSIDTSSLGEVGKREIGVNVETRCN